VLDFRKGFALGIAVGMTVIMALLAHEARGMARMFADMGSPHLPLLTRATLSGVWLIGVPLGGAAASAMLWFLRPRSLVPYIVVALVLLVAVVLTWYGPRLPIFELAGNIKAD
jgi:hypothetical protein